MLPNTYLLIAVGVFIVGCLHGPAWTMAKKPLASLATAWSNPDGAGLLCGWLTALYERLTYQLSPVTQLVVTLFEMLAALVIFLRNVCETFTKRALDELRGARAARIRQPGPMEPSIQQSRPAHDAIFLALVLLVASVVFAGANFVILRIGLPIVFPTERKLLAVRWFNRVWSVTPTTLLAMVVMAVEWLLAGLYHDFAHVGGLLKKSKPAAALCLAGVLVMGAFSAVLAIERTRQMDTIDVLPLAAIGTISFLVPVVASMAMGYLLGFLPTLGYLLGVVVAGCLALPFQLVVTVLALVLTVVLRTIEASAVPAVMVMDFMTKRPPSDPPSAVASELPKPTAVPPAKPVKPPIPTSPPAEPPTLEGLTIVGEPIDPAKEVTIHAMDKTNDNGATDYLRGLRTESILE